MNRACRPTAPARSWLSLFGTIALAGACGRGVLEDLPEREVATEETGNVPAENEPSSEGPRRGSPEPEVLGPEPRGAQPPPPSPPRGPNGDAGAEGAASATPLDSTKPPATGTVTEENQPALLLDAGSSPPADEAAPAQEHAPPERETSQEPGPEQQPSVLQYVEIAPATGNCKTVFPVDSDEVRRGGCWLGETWESGLTVGYVEFKSDASGVIPEYRLRVRSSRERALELVVEATGYGRLGEAVCTVRGATPGNFATSEAGACAGAVSAELRVFERVAHGFLRPGVDPREVRRKRHCSVRSTSIDPAAVLSCPNNGAQARLQRGSNKKEDARRWLGVSRGKPDADTGAAPAVAYEAHAVAYDAAGAQLCELWTHDSDDWVYTANPDCSGAVELQLETWEVPLGP